LIGNSKYDNVRKAGKTAYLDIDQASQDVHGMSTFFQELGFDKVIKTENANFDDFKSAYDKMVKELSLAHK
jgi:hypothetical protein